MLELSRCDEQQAPRFGTKHPNGIKDLELATGGRNVMKRRTMLAWSSVSSTRFFLILTVLLAMAAVASGDHGTGSGRSFTFLEAGFTQEITGVSSHFMGGVAFSPEGDVWVNDCLFAGSELHRFDLQGVAPEAFGTALHPESIVSSNAGCGMTNHPDGFIYSNTGLGVVQIDAATGAPTGKIVGPPGNALGIAPDPQTGDLVYVAENCRFTGTCDILTVDPDTGVSSTFVRLPGFNFVDGIYFSPDGSKLFLAKRSPGFAVTVIDRSAPAARTGAFNRDIALPTEPDGIAFHQDGFVVTANTDGTLSKIVPGPDSVTLFASGGGRSDLTQVGSDSCLYVTQDIFTRYDDGTVTTQSSVVRICPGFVPPPGAGKPGLLTGGGTIPTANGEPVTHGFQLNCEATKAPNNLQINWNGNRFHLEFLTLAACTDSPDIVPNPPPAGFDTYVGAGIGRYNGVPGYKAEWKFTDAGEPGENDSARIVIRDPSDNVVLSVSGRLSRGNHQAHKAAVR